MDKRELANRIVGRICTDLVILPLPARWEKLVDKVEEELIAAEQSVHTDAPKPFVNHCNPVNGVHAPFCNGDHSARG